MTFFEEICRRIFSIFTGGNAGFWYLLTLIIIAITIVYVTKNSKLKKEYAKELQLNNKLSEELEIQKIKGGQ